MKTIILFIAIIFLSGCNRIDKHQPQTNTQILFDEDKKIDFEFLSNRNNMNTVSICLRNYSDLVSKYTFEISEADNKKNILRSLNFSGTNIDNSDCTKFRFDPISNSEGKKYIISIKEQVSELSINTKVRSKVYIEAYNDLWHYKTHYKQPLKEIINEVFNDLLVRIRNDVFFFFSYLILLVLIFLYTIRNTK